MSVQHKNNSFSNKYELIKQLGKGGFSKVIAAYDQELKKEVALKVFSTQKKRSNKELEGLCKIEAQAMKKVHHKNILALEGEPFFLESNENGTRARVAVLPLEMASNGELFDVIYNTGNFSEYYARAIFHQLLSAVETCHNAGMCHRDLKLENILVNSDFEIKIADFGFAISKKGEDGNGVCYTRKGTEQYMAPELLRKQPYNPQETDLFALAVILFIMINYNPPFTKADPLFSKHYEFMVNDQVEDFWYYHRKQKPDKRTGYSAEFKSLMESMFAADPEQRLTISQIKEHPWYKADRPSDEELRRFLRLRYMKMHEQADEDM